MTSFITLSIGCMDNHGLNTSGFPPIAQRGWTGNQPTVRTFTLEADSNTLIDVPLGTLLVASPMTGVFNLRAKRTGLELGVPICGEETALNIPWCQPWDGVTETLYIANLEEETEQSLTLYFF